MALNTDFAFEGFRLIRQRPVLLIYWGLFYLIMSLATTVIMVAMAGPELLKLTAINPNSRPDIYEYTALYAKILPAYAIVFVVSLVMGSVITCAVYRAFEEKSPFGLAYLRFGKDEVRQLMVVLLFGLFIAVIYIFLCLLTVIVITVTMPTDYPKAVVGGIALIIMFSMLFLMIIPSLRLSLCGPQSFYTKKLTIFGSWKLTKGVAGSLVGGYLLALILSLLIFILGQIIFSVLAILAFGFDMEMLRSMYEPDLSSFAALQKPVNLISLGLMAFVNVTTSVLFIGAQAGAYRQLAR
jgi:hypothetical protein